MSFGPSRSTQPLQDTESVFKCPLYMLTPELASTSHSVVQFKVFLKSSSGSHASGEKRGSKPITFSSLGASGSEKESGADNVAKVEFISASLAFNVISKTFTVIAGQDFVHESIYNIRRISFAPELEENLVYPKRSPLDTLLAYSTTYAERFERRPKGSRIGGSGKSTNFLMRRVSREVSSLASESPTRLSTRLSQERAKSTPGGRRTRTRYALPIEGMYRVSLSYKRPRSKFRIRGKQLADIELYFSTKWQARHFIVLLKAFVKVSNAKNHSFSSRRITPEVTIPNKAKLEVWVGTWNMGKEDSPLQAYTSKGPVGIIEQWCGLESSSSKKNRRGAPKKSNNGHDVYCFSIQEAGSNIFSLTYAVMINHGLQLVEKRTVGLIHNFIFAKPDILKQIDNIQYREVKFGGQKQLSLLKTSHKATVAVGFTVSGTPFTFLSSHLEARESNADFRRRNRQVKSSINGTKMGLLSSIECPLTSTVFWAGDLNYRSKTKELYRDADYGYKELWEELRRGKEIWKVMYDELDTLNIEKNKSIVFTGFQEMIPDFPPSYKYKVLDMTLTNDESKVNGKNSLFHKALEDINLPESKEKVNPKSWRLLQRKLDGRVDIVGLLSEGAVRATSFSSYLNPFINRKDGDLDRCPSPSETYFVSCREENIRREMSRVKKLQAMSYCDRILFKPLVNTKVKALKYETFDNVHSSDHNQVAGVYSVEYPNQSCISCVADDFLVCSIQFSQCEIITMRNPKIKIKDLLAESRVPEGYKREFMGGEPMDITKDLTLTDLRKRAALSWKRTENIIGNRRKYFGESKTLSSPGGTKRLVVTGSFFNESDEVLDVEEEDERVENIPESKMHINAARLCLQAPFLKYASKKTKFMSSTAKSKLEFHSYLPYFSVEKELGYYEKQPMGGPCEFSFNSQSLVSMTVGPMLSTCAFLSTQNMVLTVLDGAERSRTDRSGNILGSCELSLEQAALGVEVSFCRPLIRESQVVGFIRGKYRVVYDETRWKSKGNVFDPMVSLSAGARVPANMNDESSRDIYGFELSDELKRVKPFAFRAVEENKI